MRGSTDDLEPTAPVSTNPSISSFCCRMHEEVTDGSDAIGEAGKDSLNWAEYFDETYQEKYYYNIKTGVSQWVAPECFSNNTYSTEIENLTTMDSVSLTNNATVSISVEKIYDDVHTAGSGEHNIDIVSEYSDMDESSDELFCDGDADCSNYYYKSIDNDVIYHDGYRSDEVEDHIGEDCLDEMSNEYRMDPQPAPRNREIQSGDPLCSFMQRCKVVDSPVVETVEIDGVTYSNKVDCFRDKDGDTGLGRTMNQDYVALAKIYKITRKYSDHKYDGLCILCKSRKCQFVFFPCGHRCVCNECIEQERICSDLVYSNRNNAVGVTLLDSEAGEQINDVGQCNCPLCGEIIKRMLPHEGGAEEAKYWDWVLSVKPPLPRGFIKRFNYSADIIKDVCVNSEYRVVAPGSLEAASERMQDNLHNPSGLFIEMMDGMGISQMHASNLKKYRRRRKQRNIHVASSNTDGTVDETDCVVT